MILKRISNNRFNLINPLSRFVLLASLVYAQTAPSPSGADLKVKRMLYFAPDIERYPLLSCLIFYFITTK